MLLPEMGTSQILHWPPFLTFYPERLLLFGLRGENKEDKRAKKDQLFRLVRERTYEIFGLKLDKKKRQLKVNL